MTSGQSVGYRLRRVILVVGVVFTMAGIAWSVLPFFNEFFGINFIGLIGTVLIVNPIAADSELGYGINVVVVVGLLLVLQWMFLRPGKGWSVRMVSEGRPLKTSVIAAGVIAMLLTAGLVACLLEFPNLWERIVGGDDWGGPIGIGVSMLVVWGVWAWVFFVYWRQGDRYTQLGRMIRGLVAGSILETIVAVPVHIWATRQRDCYCYRGSYTTLVIAGTVLIWAFGPGIVLLYMREKYRRAKLETNPPNKGSVAQIIREALYFSTNFSFYPL